MTKFLNNLLHLLKVCEGYRNKFPLTLKKHASEELRNEVKTKSFII